MKQINWVNIEESQGGNFDKLEPGFYVAFVTAVQDHMRDEYLDIVWDIAEGPRAGFYSDEWGTMNTWAHSFRRYYKEDSQKAFSKFLGDVERSNAGRFTKAAFTATANENLLVGMCVGICLQKRFYTGKDGKDKEVLEVRYTLTADKVRSGDTGELPEPRDQRESGGTTAPTPTLVADYVPVPF